MSFKYEPDSEPLHIAFISAKVSLIAFGETRFTTQLLYCYQ